MIEAGHETLLGSSSVYLFGRLLLDIILRPNKPNPYGAASIGANQFLKRQFDLEKNDVPQAKLARIYAFSYEGGLFELPRPAIFLVHGEGQDPDAPEPTNFGEEIEYESLARSPGPATRTGLGRQTGAFAVGTRVWIYDKGDFSMRLETDSGTFEQILLASELGNDAWGTVSGGMARSSGGLARSSGVMARSSGATGRKRGDFE